MKTRNVPDPETALADLAGFTPALFEVMEGAMLEARDYFRRRGEKVNNWTYCCLVRYHALLLFKKHGFKPDELPNNGLCLTFGRYKIKLYKLFHDEVPPPGPSRKRQRFYKMNAQPIQDGPWQPSLLAPALMSLLSRLPGGAINLIVTWEPTKYFDLSGLSLACPKNGTHNPAKVDLFWQTSIPHPAHSLVPDEDAFVADGVPDLEISVQPTVSDEDLDISIEGADDEVSGTEEGDATDTGSGSD